MPGNLPVSYERNLPAINGPEIIGESGAKASRNLWKKLLGAAAAGILGYGIYKNRGRIKAGLGAAKDHVNRFIDFVKSKFGRGKVEPTIKERFMGAVDRGVASVKAHPKLALGVGGGAGLALLGAGAYAYNRNRHGHRHKAHRRK